MQSASEQEIPEGHPFDVSEQRSREHALHCFACGGSIGTVTCTCREYDLPRNELANALAWTYSDGAGSASPPSPAPMVEQAGELKPCPFCGNELFMRRGVNPYGRCGTEGCWAHERRISVPLGDPTQVAQWNTRPAPAETEGKAIYVWWADDGVHIRKWDHKPFEHGEPVTAIASTPPADAGMLREALIDLESAGSNVLKSVDSYNEANGTALGGAPFIVLGRRIASARAALNSQAHQIREGDHG